MTRHLGRLVSSIVVLGLILSSCVSKFLLYNKKDIATALAAMPIRYGASIRFRAAGFAYHLHSHLPQYPRGSGYQSVTGMSLTDDPNSLWALKEAHQESVKTYNTPVKCGDVLRLEHVVTRRNLHSEQLYQSMITSAQEVSAFGNNGFGDENDNWQIKCLKKAEGESLLGGDVIELLHENTQMRLKISRYYEYSPANWENCPFPNQLEVSGVTKSSIETQFKIVGGIFISDSSQKSNENPTSSQL